MGNKLFGVNISKHIKDAIGPAVLDATLTKYTQGSRTPGSLTGGKNPTSTDYSCKGFIDRQARKDMSGTLVDDGTMIIVLIGDTIGAVPEAGDRVTIEGSTHTIGVVDRDPAGATYTLQVKGSS